MDIRRAAMSIPSNLSELQNQPAGGDSLEFWTISRDLLAELKGHLLAAVQNPILSAAGIDPLLQQVDNLEIKLQEQAAGLT